MNWFNAKNSDEHILCDERGTHTEYVVRRDPITFVYRAYDGERRIREALAIYPCQQACEESYQSERKVSGQQLKDKRQERRANPSNPPRGKRGAYSNRGAA